MTSLTYQPTYQNLQLNKTGESAISRFLSWIKSEEKNRIAWVGVSITLMTAVFFPITMSAILFQGAIFKLIIGAMVPLVLVIITNLAALPTKYTIPAFLLGILMDICLIVTSFIL